MRATESIQSPDASPIGDSPDPVGAGGGPVDDSALLAEFVRSHSEEAFSSIVGRHLDLVCCVAYSRVRNHALSRDVAQTVFITLARKAAGLPPGVILSGWLFRTARFAAADAMKSEMRRERREMQAARMETNPGENGSQSTWEELVPLLPEALAVLRETDRRCILLRFFERKSLREVGAALGIREVAARQRVARAAEKLHRFFANRGVGISAALLLAGLSGLTLQAAPAGLHASIVAEMARLAGTLPTAATPSVRIVRRLRPHAQAFVASVLVSVAVAVAFLRFAGPASPLEALRARNEALRDGDGARYVSVIYFRPGPEEALKPLLDENTRARGRFVKAIRDRLGDGAADGVLLRLADILTDRQLSDANVTIEDRAATVALVGGPGLKFVRDGNAWKFDLLRMPGIPPATPMAAGLRRDTVAMDAMVPEIRAGTYANAPAILEELRKRSAIGATP